MIQDELEKRIKELEATLEQMKANCNALAGRIAEAKYLLEQMYGDAK